MAIGGCDQKPTIVSMRGADGRGTEQRWLCGNIARSRYGSSEIGSKIERATALYAITQLFLHAMPFRTEDRESA